MGCFYLFRFPFSSARLSIRGSPKFGLRPKCLGVRSMIGNLWSFVFFFFFDVAPPALHKCQRLQTRIKSLMDHLALVTVMT